MVKDQLDIYYQNVRGLRTKTGIFYESILAENYDIIALSETWLNDSIHSSELFDDRYVVYRRDRDVVGTGMGRGGGVLLAVDRRLRARQLYADQLIARELDALWVEVTSPVSNVTIVVNVVYFPPNSRMQLYDNYCSFIENSNNFIFKNLLLVGDFNLPEVCGVGYNFSLGSGSCKLVSQLLSLFNLSSFNNIFNTNNTTLDLVFSNMFLSVEGLSEGLVPVDSHHPPLLIHGRVESSIEPRLNDPSVVKSYYCFKEANFLNLYCNLRDSSWNELYNCSNVNEALDKFYNLLFNCININVPKHNVIFKSKYPCWFSREIISCIKVKNKLARKRKYSRYHNEMFITTRATLKAKISDAHKRYVQFIESGIDGDIKYFWNYIKSKRLSKNCDLGSLSNMVYNGNTVHKNEIPQAFADYFSSVYDSTASSYNVSVDHDVKWADNHDAGYFSVDQVVKAINRLKSKKSSGPDEIPAYVVKGCRDVIAKPLCYIFNLALFSHTFPDRWKVAKVVPIFKSGCRENIENYRPISLINSFAKVFEILLFDQIYLCVKSKINPQQHGFLPFKSSTTNLMELTYDISVELDVGGRVDVIYTDFSKAFDKVNHDVLLQKLFNIGFSTNFTKFIASYLQNRSQVVSISNLNSNSYISKSGVPQGSNLGPLLFLIFINDLPDVLTSCKSLLYADDLKLYRPIRNKTDEESLQADINALCDWCLSNKLYLNVKKCFSMSFNRRKNRVLLNYSVNGKQLDQVFKIRDLGVIFDSELKFDDHLTFITNEAYKMLGFVIRNSKLFRACETIIKLYYSFVRSRLEYCSVVWAPSHNTAINQIEIIQNRFLRYLFFKKFNVYCQWDFPTSELRAIFSVDKLSVRRNLFILSFVFKLINFNINSPFLLSLLSLHVPRNNLRPSILFSLPRCNTVSHYNFSLYRILRFINAKSNNFDMFNDSFNVFKCSCLEILRSSDS
jgi:hypothetical protein